MARYRRGAISGTKPIEVFMSAEYRNKMNDYMTIMELQNPADAVRDLVIIALSSLPEDGIIAAIRLREFNTVRRAAFKELNAFCNDLGARVQSSVENPNINPEDR